MKKLSILLPLLCLLLTSCVDKAWGPFSYKSPNEEIELIILGEQKVAFDPIMVNITVKTPAGNKPFQFELMAEELGENNLEVNWRSELTGAIHLTQRDGTVKTLNMDFRNEEIRIIQNINYDVLH